LRGKAGAAANPSTLRVATRRQRRSRLSPPPKGRTIGDKRGDRDEALMRWCETMRSRKRRVP